MMKPLKYLSLLAVLTASSDTARSSSQSVVIMPSAIGPWAPWDKGHRSAFVVPNVRHSFELSPVVVSDSEFLTLLAKRSRELAAQLTKTEAEYKKHFALYEEHAKRLKAIYGHWDQKQLQDAIESEKEQILSKVNHLYAKHDGDAVKQRDIENLREYLNTGSLHKASSTFAALEARIEAHVRRSKLVQELAKNSEIVLDRLSRIQQLKQAVVHAEWLRQAKIDLAEAMGNDDKIRLIADQVYLAYSPLLSRFRDFLMFKAKIGPADGFKNRLLRLVPFGNLGYKRLSSFVDRQIKEFYLGHKSGIRFLYMNNRAEPADAPSGAPSPTSLQVNQVISDLEANVATEIKTGTVKIWNLPAEPEKKKQRLPTSAIAAIAGGSALVLAGAVYFFLMRKP